MAKEEGIAVIVYPWQHQQWEKLILSKNQNRVPHALLLLGAGGLGKKHFALSWGKLLLCTLSCQRKLASSESLVPCEQCHSCHLINAQSHPDFLLVEPEQAGGIIKIDQIRQVIQFVSETALQGHNRVIIIHPASSMNMAAANALLKTLEEPAPNTFLLLVCEPSGNKLPATITSRCQNIIFHQPDPSLARNWLLQQNIPEDSLQIALDLAEGAPLKAKDFIENGFLQFRNEFYQNLLLLSQNQADPLRMAAQYLEQDLRLLLNLLLNWVRDLIKLKLTQSTSHLTNRDYHSTFEKLSSGMTISQLFSYVDHLLKINKSVMSNINLNRQLLLEELFIRWVQHAS